MAVGLTVLLLDATVKVQECEERNKLLKDERESIGRHFQLLKVLVDSSREYSLYVLGSSAPVHAQGSALLPAASSRCRELCSSPSIHEYAKTNEFCVRKA